MSNAKKCPACGNWYNAVQYVNCPYCQDKNVVSQEKKKETASEKSSFFSGLFKKKPTDSEKKTYVNTQTTERNNSRSNNIGNSTIDQVTEDMKDQVSVSFNIPKTESVFGNSSHIEQTRETGQSNLNLNNQSLQIPEDKNIEGSEQKYSGTVTVAVSNHDNQSTHASKNETISLSQGINLSGRTVGKYVSNSQGESIAPVVGWLVSIKGEYYGQSFNLKKGRNRIGRSHDYEVKLLNDSSVSRSCVAIITYDTKKNEFFILPGESDSLCYVNEDALYEKIQLEGYEEIEFGDNGMNKYIFVPFCNHQFEWSSNPKE